MIETSDQERRRGFSIWLRTGRLPSIRNADGVELNFIRGTIPKTDGSRSSGPGGIMASGAVADLTEAGVTASVERVRPAHGAAPSRSGGRYHHAVRQQPSGLWIALARQARLLHDRQARRASIFVAWFAMANPIR